MHFTSSIALSIIVASLGSVIVAANATSSSCGCLLQNSEPFLTLNSFLFPHLFYCIVSSYSVGVYMHSWSFKYCPAKSSSFKYPSPQVANSNVNVGHRVRYSDKFNVSFEYHRWKSKFVCVFSRDTQRAAFTWDFGVFELGLGPLGGDCEWWFWSSPKKILIYS